MITGIVLDERASGHGTGPFSAEETNLLLYVLEVYTENVGGADKADDPAVYRKIEALKNKVAKITKSSG